MKNNHDESNDSSYECSEEVKPNKLRRFLCKQCKKRFSSKQCLKEHSYKHKDLKPYKCQMCNQSFRHASQFTLHKQSHKSTKEILWPALAELDRKQLVILNYGDCTDDEIQLPKISKPHSITLPSFSSILKID